MPVVDATGVDDDADFAACLDGECVVDAGESAGEAFEFLETPDVFFERFAAGSGASSGDGICGGDEDRIDVFGADIVVVSCCGVDDFGTFAVAFEKFSADGWVPAFHFVIGGFADVVEEATASGECAIKSELFCHHTREVGDFDGVLAHILAV